MVNTRGPGFREGQMEYCSKLVGMLLRDKANWRDLKILKRGGNEKGLRFVLWPLPLLNLM